MAVIVPAILEDNIDTFHDRLGAILKIPNVNRIQIDISDGKFTSRATLPLSELDPLNPAYFWEAHLMVQSPSDYFLDAKILGFNGVIFSFEAVSQKEQLKEMAAELTKLKIQAALCINPETDLAEVAPYLQYFEEINLMAVKPGAQGKEFIASTYARLEKLSKIKGNAKIEIDGGIKLNNARQLAAGGADFLVVGSALFEANSPARNFEQFEIEIQNAKT